MGPDDYLDDEEEPRWSFRSILASGWFRAGLLLGGVVIALVLTLPYALRWMSPSEPRTAAQARRVVEPPRAAPTPMTAPPAPSVGAPGGPVVAGTDRPAADKPADGPKAATDGSVPSTDRIVPASDKPIATSAKPIATSAKPIATSDKPIATSDKPAGAPDKPAADRTVTSADRTAPADRPASVAEKPAAPPPASIPARTPAVAGPAVESTKPAATVKTTASRPARTGDFWVQVGAFQEAENAERLQKTLRKSGMPAAVTHVAREAPVPAHRHEVVVTGTTPEAVNAALRGSGTARAMRGSVVVQPPLELKDAVSVSKRLTAEGLTVKIRRVGGDAADQDRAPQHVVRVGPYDSRSEAAEVRRDLAGKGLAGFVAQGPAR